MKIKSSIWKVLLILTAVTAVVFLVFILWALYKHHRTSQWFSVSSNLTALEYIQRGDIPAAKAFLEMQLAGGVIYLPNDDALIGDSLNWNINRTLVEAKCYGEKYSWKNISPEIAQSAEKALNEKLLNGNSKCP